MTFQRLGLLLLLLLPGSLCTVSAQAGGPLRMVSGRPVVWSSDSPVQYNIDQGPLGPLSSEEAAEMVQGAFGMWADTPGITLSFQKGPDLTEDVGGDNFFLYLDGTVPGTNPVVFDSDGAITRAILGTSADSDFMGFASLVRIRNDRILAAQAVFNGNYIQQSNSTVKDFFATVVHEFGHFVGLDHSQHLRHLAYDGVGENDRDLPMMLPSAADDESMRDRLSDDDKAALVNLYPPPDLAARSGRIEGMIRRGTTELPGVNVIARRVGSVSDQIYSTVSGTFQYNRGTYSLRGLPPGAYQIWIEPIDPYFSEASSVGQYAKTPRDKSFQNPPPARFWSEGNSSRSAWSPVPVEAGQTATGIDFDATPESSLDDEVETQLVGLDSPEAGGVESSSQSYFEYLFVPSGREGRVRITVRAKDPGIPFDLLVHRGGRVKVPRDPAVTGRDGTASMVLGENGDLPLLADRYFVSVRNKGSGNVNFFLTVTREEEIPPTPTPPVNTDIRDWAEHRQETRNTGTNAIGR